MVCNTGVVLISARLKGKQAVTRLDVAVDEAMGMDKGKSVSKLRQHM